MAVSDWTDEKLQAVAQSVAVIGREKTADVYGLSADTIRRYVSEAKSRGIDTDVDRRAALANRLVESFDASELSAMLNSGAHTNDHHTFRYDAGNTGRIKLGVMSDTHIGSKQFERWLWDAAIEKMHAEDVDMILHPGDLTEGMSNRPGHVYELTHIGYEAQKGYAAELLQGAGIPIKIIDGNHDRWFIKSAGAHIVKSVADLCDNVEFLGHDQADVVIDGLTIRVVHGEDGGSYAVSYRLQKFIEAMHQNADVPEVAIFAHAHKQAHVSYMGVESISAGALQSTTPWMRGKRNYSVLGFYILEIEHDGDTIHEFTPRWFPGDKLR